MRVGAVIALLIAIALAWAGMAYGQEQGHEHGYEACGYSDHAERCRCECREFHCDWYRACEKYEDDDAKKACFSDVQKVTENCQASCDAT